MNTTGRTKNEKDGICAAIFVLERVQVCLMMNLIMNAFLNNCFTTE